MSIFWERLSEARYTNMLSNNTLANYEKLKEG